MKKYEVQHHTLCDGWINTWTVIDHENREQPDRFETEADAQAAIDDFFDDIAAEIARGDRNADEGYDRDEFCVVEIDDQTESDDRNDQPYPHKITPTSVEE